MSQAIECPSCGSTDHYAYSKGRRRYRRDRIGGNVVSRGRECRACGLPFTVLEVPLDTREGMALWRMARNGT